jgi:[ribosomal protein S18]-alanine N-acetyltransferase
MLEQQFRIRRATPADLNNLVMLENACFAIPWSQESLQRDLEDNPLARYLVAELPDGTLAGYAACWFVVDEGHVTNVAVSPSWRGQGLGRRLLDELIQLAEIEKIQLMTLEVRVGNHAARSLYQAGGFQDVGLRRGYYADNNEDAIIMLKIVNG